MDYSALAKDIVTYLGGKENIGQYWHCITRLRFNVVDEKRIRVDDINALDGVIGSQFSGGQYQIIIGPHVADAFEAIKGLLGEASDAKGRAEQQLSPLEKLFDVISGIFTPILPAIVGAGLLKGLLALFLVLNWLSEASSTYTVLYMIADGTFYFLPFLVAMTAADKFKVDRSLSMALAAVILYPTLVNGAADHAKALLLFGLPVPMNNYTASVLPIILGVLLLSFVHRWISRLIPKSITIVFTPVLSITVTAALLLTLIAPLGNVAGGYLVSIFSVAFEKAGPLAGLLMGGLMPVIVITGMHYAFFPSTMTSFKTLGYDIMLLPMNLVANIAQVGAVLGVLLRAKDAKLKNLSFSTLLPAIFGITEPAIYGVTLKLKKPFYASLVGGGIGGMIFGFFTVRATAFSIPGITALPTYVMKNNHNIYYALLGYLVSFSVALVITLILGFDEEGQAKPKRTRVVSDDSKTSETQKAMAKRLPTEIAAPTDGRVVPLEQVPDKLFSKGILGKGVGIDSSTGLIVAPFDAEVVTLAPSKHAIGLKSQTGVELLIHIGIDTVNLKGQGFEQLVAVSDHVKKGQALLAFDQSLIHKANLDATVIVIVTNSHDFFEIDVTKDTEVRANDTLILNCIN
ncbi:beta-glucoside-specific PTS transporter subunit IIABC [Streptococcus equi]|uniref:beta-glucoside-specific PTS transporter subunit IIABC n=1 Tax=Streptococcus equi TaxID=1336 RepID=UPI0005BDF1B7|nr:beta-glucoside-specific PTS transporter subunit IIABC [Streptococcus equi]VTP92381.1 PTS system beta-glucosides-specific transporter subunit IIABC [Streptococcus equi subsp. zooepidemicus]KIS15637.1 PTS system beta-glucosides-specific transporter subunit IIABC [Streptococcus equi subsp. zooepidemicus SzAM35]HEK9994988.1 PTS glucose transporter subunit IIA [Streptococcus equi subsp. zooepidemicus]HEL0583206.1 PTS glucose transporter subunit IIA [Streptococcus equi subsp. zooepidemicus]HEL059